MTTETSEGTTPSQTVGPFFHAALPWSDGSDVDPDGDVTLTVRVLAHATSCIGSECRKVGRFDRSVHAYASRPSDIRTPRSPKFKMPAPVSQGMTPTTTPSRHTGAGDPLPLRCPNATPNRGQGSSPVSGYEWLATHC